MIHLWRCSSRLLGRLGAVCLALGLVLWLAGCGGEAPAPAGPSTAAPADPTVAPTHAAASTGEPGAATSTPGEAAAVLLPTLTPTSGATATSIDWLTTATVEGDYYILGNPAAPVRLRDYSDFL